ncbi:hypothetical protein D7S86_08120 [Pararobbsia silviterrae]|uniref:Uncharacterized protein n=2 Tax=Pararobbsia silviterrae TaxID=1792498 RepID=A0A494Y0Q5_9BURK|nr:hypothetical protein D7S86_08120 [Pararobbsia silviterrae]
MLASQAASDPQYGDLSAGGMPAFTSGQVGQIAGGAAHGIGSLVNNAANLVEQGVSSGLNAIPGIRDTALARAVRSTANADTSSQAKTDQDFSKNASPGAQAASIVTPFFLPMGSVADAGSAVGNAVRAIPGMGGTAGRLIGAGLGNAATGALASAGSPINPNGPDYWSQVGGNAALGGLLGAAAPAVASAGRAVGSGVTGLLSPVLNPGRYVGQGIANALGDQAGDVAANIRSAPQFVPGSQPTTAQAGANPTLVATEKAAANANPDFKMALAQRGIDNNDARWGALMGVAGTPADLQAAQAARDAAASPLYQQAHAATANVGPAFMRYAQIPEMQQAMQAAHSAAALDAAVGRGVPPVWPTPTSNTINGSALDYTSRALGDMINDAQRQGANSRAASLTALKSSVDGWTQRYIPGVQAAKDAYAAGSVPINTMEVGQQIANGLGTRSMNAGGAPEIQMMPFRSGLTQAMRGAPYGIDANALNTLQGIGQDLQRSTVSNSLKSPGSDTAYNLAANGWLARNLYGPAFGGSTGLGRTIAGVGTAAAGHPWAGLAAAGGIGKVGQAVGNRLNAQLSNLLLNPNALLPYLDARAAPTVNAAQQALPGLLQRQVLPAAIGGITRGGLMNSN